MGRPVSASVNTPSVGRFPSSSPPVSDTRPAQIWVDNHGNQHEVLRGRLVAGTAAGAFPNQGPVKLQRRIPVMPRTPVNGVLPTITSDTTAGSFNGYIGAIWFVPNSDKLGNVITPIYATVEEL